LTLAVFLFPFGDDGAGFINMVEAIHVGAFIAHETVEGFDEAMAPGLTCWNVMDAEFFFRELSQGHWQ
jgi:hypothetical protein